MNKAPGIDGVTARQYEENLYENIWDLTSRLKHKRYRPQPGRRAYIPKDEKSKRPLGIPVVEDKTVQMGIKKILEAIYEVDFRYVNRCVRDAFPKSRVRGNIKHGSVRGIGISHMVK